MEIVFGLVHLKLLSLYRFYLTKETDMKTITITVKDALKAGEWYDLSNEPWTPSKEDFEFEYSVELSEDFIKEFYFRKSISLDAKEIWDAVISHDIVDSGKPMITEEIIKRINKPFDEVYSYMFAGCLIAAVVKCSQLAQTQ